ncbi:MAG: response regulator [Chitinophagales bacterium]
MSGLFQVFMADDDKDDRFLMRMAFKEIGIPDSLLLFEDGVFLLEHLDAAQNNGTQFPSLILLDLNMPRLNGLEVLEKIKSKADWRKIPVVIFSTSDRDVDVQRAYELGANSYITKPADFDRLTELVKCLHNYWGNTVTPPLL